MDRTMNRTQLLAAELFNYSYANYQDHLGVNIRFDELMPQTVSTLEKAEAEEWPLKELARELEVDSQQAEDLLERLQDAREVVEAENPAEAFRNGVRQSIHMAMESALDSAEDIEKLVRQICYRAADLAYLLKAEGSSLSRYSRHLRREPEVEYHEGYFDEEE
jgi:Mn-dependent DtxR family transcriptional regulator